MKARTKGSILVASAIVAMIGAGAALSGGGNDRAVEEGARSSQRGAQRAVRARRACAAQRWIRRGDVRAVVGTRVAAAQRGPQPAVRPRRMAVPDESCAAGRRACLAPRAAPSERGAQPAVQARRAHAEVVSPPYDERAGPPGGGPARSLDATDEESDDPAPRGEGKEVMACSRRTACWASSRKRS